MKITGKALVQFSYGDIEKKIQMKGSELRNHRKKICEKFAGCLIFNEPQTGITTVETSKESSKMLLSSKAP